MKFLRNSLTGVVAVLATIIGFWQYHRHMVAAHARNSLAQAYHISQNQVTIEGVQELGFWRDKLNPFIPHSWSVLFTTPGGPAPADGSYGCTIDEPSFAHFGPPIVPGRDPNMPAKH